jgi:AAA+ superfamily predicted ATPase
MLNGQAAPHARGQAVAIESGPYTSNREHLVDELRRIDCLIRAQTLRWRMTIGASKPENLWGMLQVSDAEINDFISSDFLPPGHLPEEMIGTLSPWWEQAAALRASIDKRLAHTPSTVDLRLKRLKKLFGLSSLQCDLLLVCLLPELDGRYRRLFGYLMDDASRMQPTVELIAQILLPEIDWPLSDDQTDDDNSIVTKALGKSDALLMNLLVVLDGETRGDESLSMRSVRLDERISAFLLDEDLPEGRLDGILSYSAGPLETSGLPFSLPQVDRLQTLAEKLRQSKDAKPVLLFYGPYGSGRLKAARALCRSAGFRVMVASTQAAINSSLGWEQTVRLCYREAALQEAALYWEGCEVLLERLPDASVAQMAQRWDYLISIAERSHVLSAFATHIAWYPTKHFRSREFLGLEFPPQPFDLRVLLWKKYLRQHKAFNSASLDLHALARELSNDFQFTDGQIQDSLATAYSLAVLRDPLQPAIQSQDLYEGCRRQSSRSLVAYARRIETRAELTWDDLIMPVPNKRQLEEVSASIQYRHLVYSELGFERQLSLGKGLIVLFTGTSGTGKTMAAELLARERGVNLYKVDLSAVTSKWVGETEKNLARLFAEAEEANAIIFFDEADALFGKRGEVKEAQDRWANMEVNYLLQRIEEYAGVVILASNLRQNIDEAFLRRIQWVVDFPFPGPRERFEIFKRMFPSSVGRPANEGLQILAERFRLTGGSIKNVVVDATFRSLVGYDPGSGQPPRVQMSHLVLSVAREYQKLGIPLTKGEFGESYYNYVENKILAPEPKNRSMNFVR